MWECELCLSFSPSIPDSQQCLTVFRKDCWAAEWINKRWTDIIHSAIVKCHKGYEEYYQKYLLNDSL